MTDYDYKGYADSLKAILDAAQKDYVIQLVDINRHQVNVARTYLWVSAALLGAYFALLNYFYSKVVDSHICSLAIIFLAAALSVLAFSICLYAIPARNGYKFVHKEGWGELSHNAHCLLQNNTPNLFAAFLTDFIARVDQAQFHCFKTNQQRARLLRATSWFLVGSIAAALLGGGMVVMSTTYATMEKQAMSENNPAPTNGNTAAVSSAQPTPAEGPLVPTPPPPAGAVGGSIYTHSISPPLGKDFFIERKVLPKDLDK